MADLTVTLELTTAWKDISTDQSFANNQRYLFHPLNGDFRNRVRLAETDDANEPTVPGNTILYLNERPRGSFIYRQRNGARLWLRSTRGPVELSVTPTSGA